MDSNDLRTALRASVFVLVAAALVAGLVTLIPVAPVHSETIRTDGNGRGVLAGVSNADSITPIMVRIDSATKSMWTPIGTDTEATGYSIDQNLKGAATGLRLHRVDLLETGGGIGYGAIRDTPGGAGSCTGKVLCYFYTVANGAAVCDFGERGVSSPTGVCLDRLAGTYSVSTHTLSTGSN